MTQVHFREDVRVNSFSEEKISLIFPHKEIQVESPKPSLFQRFSRLMGHGTIDPLVDDSFSEFFLLLEQLKQASLLSYSVIDGQQPLMTLTPYSTCDFAFNETPIDSNLELKISRFAYFQKGRIHSPLFKGSVALKSPEALLFFHSLSSPKSINQLNKEFPSLPVNDLFSMLYHAHLLSNADEIPSLKTWEFHDLLFHTKSRKRDEGAHGGTFRFLDKIPPEKAIKKVKGALIPLYAPDCELLMKTDPPFAKVQEERRSIREWTNKPMNQMLLGEFFYRVARVKAFKEQGVYETTKRPYPGGGACYELELYPLISRCEGLQRGLYRYEPMSHSLEVLNKDSNELFEMASKAMGKTEIPQVVILIAARFKRVSWKYEKIAYSVILKNTGALIQTMYLAATAMKLSPCALGSGDSDLFTSVVGADFYEETTVGEFALGC